MKTPGSGAGLLRLRMRFRLAGFSAGLATGMVLSLVAVFGLLVTYSYRRQFGESLIHLGERLASRSAGVQALSIPPQQTLAPTTTQPDQATITDPPAVLGKEEPHGKQLRATADEPESGPDVIQVPVHRNPPKQPVATATTTAPVLTIADPDTSTAAKALSNAIALPRLPLSMADDLAATKVGSLDPPSAVVMNASHRRIRPAEMYLDLGKFKDELLARKISSKLAGAGLHANVAQKGHLWMNSYHVLVGPFASDVDVSRTQRMLTALGYEPKPYERGSRSFFFSSRVTLNGSPLPQGDVTVSWESFVEDAKVKFLLGNEVLATAEGHWMPSPRKYSQDEFVYRKTMDNSKPLLELHFYGWNRILVFHDVS